MIRTIGYVRKFNHYPYYEWYDADTKWEDDEFQGPAPKKHIPFPKEDMKTLRENAE